MIRMTCEMCGNNNLIKENGEYVCQYCGTKYSVEEAKKLMVEVSGTVDVSGSKVVVDNTSFIETNLNNARRAKMKEDWEETEKYYNIVEQYDSKNIEAIFYSSYGKAMYSMLDSDSFKREHAINVLSNSVSIIDDNYDAEKYDENQKIIIQMSDDIIKMCSATYVVNVTRTNYTVRDNDNHRTDRAFVKLHLAFIESLDHIIDVVGRTNTDSEYLYDLILKHYKYIIGINGLGQIYNYQFIIQMKEKANQTEQTICELTGRKFVPLYQTPNYNYQSDPNKKKKDAIVMGIGIALTVFLIVYFIISFLLHG